MFCTETEREHCNYEKMGCSGCFFNDETNKKEKSKMRKFEMVKRLEEKIINNTDEVICAFPPKRSTRKSAGYDFYCPENIVCKSHEITMVPTGYKAYFPSNETLLLFNRSSNPKKRGLIILNGVGVVDADYADCEANEGEIAALFYNMLDEDVILQAGDKMMQGVFVEYKIVDDDNAKGERKGGFGSTNA